MTPIKKTTARILITRACNRNCTYCCNEFDTFTEMVKPLKHIVDLSSKYEEIVITGGEPLLKFAYTARLIQKIREIRPTTKIYLYTTIITEATLAMMGLCDGVTVTLHDNISTHEIGQLVILQEEMKRIQRNRSLRLHIGPGIKKSLNIVPSVWSHIKRLNWQGEDGNWVCPCEDIFMLEEKTS